MTSANPIRSCKCQYAEITSAGRGAIATVAVWGPGALAVVESSFQPAGSKPLGTAEPERIVFGCWQSDDGSVEELIVSHHDAEYVEVHCHGGVAAVRRIQQTLAAAGCQQADWRAWTRTQYTDAICADAHLALCGALTERTAAVLLDQTRGALTRAVRAIKQDLKSGNSTRASARLAKLERWSDFGLHLVAPWRVVLAGAPNAGKSSIANAILGYLRAIVDNQPGTTRDAVTTLTAVDGWPIELVDTAGFHDAAADLIETAGMARAAQELARADLVLWVSDLTTEWKSPQQVAQVVGKAPFLLVHNKADLAPVPTPDRPPGIVTSAATGAGIDDLLASIVAHIVPNAPSPGTAVPFRQHHVRILNFAIESLHANRTAQTLQAIRQMARDAPASDL